MQALFANVSSLFGLLVLLSQMWSFASIERTLISAFGTGIAVYLVLILSYVCVQRILLHTPSHSGETADGETDSQNASTSSDMQAQAA